MKHSIFPITSAVTKLLALSICTFFCMLLSSKSYGQCLQMIHNPTDTSGWVHGSSHLDHPGHYNNDTFVVCNSHMAENNFLYNTTPVTLYGSASTFDASFDFRIDSNSMCSDGLTFWFFTSSLYQLGSTAHEGGGKGFPDTVAGFALTFETIGCIDEIYMKKIVSNSFYFSSSTTPGDTNICTPPTHQMFLTDSVWHHCTVHYDGGNITTTFDGGAVVLSGFALLSGTGYFGFMGTDGAGHSRKCIKNIQICASLGVPTASSDSFSTYTMQQCNGPQITVQTNNYSPAHHVVLSYGDGSSDSSTFLLTSPYGIASFSHAYTTAGTYTIKEKLFSGTVAIDSLQYSYVNIFCSTLPVKFYYDENGNCNKESSEHFFSQPILTEIDSNGISIDTISSLSGFYYSARGVPGDIYSFRVITTPGNMAITCPSGATVYDTIAAGIFTTPDKYMGLQCTTGSNYDLGVVAMIPVTGVHDQWANVYVQNSYCAPVDGTLTMRYSPKYAGAPTQITPSSGTVSGNTITWNFAALSSDNPGPTHVHYEVEHGTVALTVGDTVHTSFTLTPVTGDVNPSNNVVIIIDTVKAGCDPNAMWVSPASCITSGAVSQQLTYTIHFENTGNDTAHNIYVLDTLSDLLDVSSMRLVLSSHTMFVSVVKDAYNHNVLKFDFPAINLLDSSHHDLCNGAVIFNIDTKPGIADGSYLINRAGIYFDVNAVVMTNQVSNNFGGCSIENIAQSSKDDRIDIYPNPTNDQLFIETAGDYSSLSIINNVGQVVIQQKLSGNKTQVNVQQLPAGVYYIMLKGKSDNVVRRFVKE